MFNRLHLNDKLIVKNGLVTTGLLEAANEFLKDYEKIYKAFWLAPFDNDQREIGAVYQAREIGKKYFGITQEAFDFIQFKVEKTNKSELKPII